MANPFGVVRCVIVLSDIWMIFLDVVLCKFYIGMNVSVEPTASSFRTVSHVFHSKIGGNRFLCRTDRHYNTEYCDIKKLTSNVLHLS
jgi:hypothetical protein